MPQTTPENKVTAALAAFMTLPNFTKPLARLMAALPSGSEPVTLALTLALALKDGVVTATAPEKATVPEILGTLEAKEIAASPDLYAAASNKTVPPPFALPEERD